MNQRLILTLGLLFFTGCAVNSITPSGAGLEMDIDIDWSKIDMRHGFTYPGQPSPTKISEMDENSLRRGEVLFQQHCLQCHGPKGKGNGELAKALKIRPADLSQISTSKDGVFLVMQIRDGKGSMPKWKDLLTAEQTQDVTHFIMHRLRNKK